MDARDRDDVRAKAQEVVDQASDTYRKTNGHSGSIEGDDGEKCWIVPFDAMENLRAALVGALPALSTHTAAGAGSVGEAPLGAIENGRVLLDRVEREYGFTDLGEHPLGNCADWIEARRCFEAMAEFIYARPVEEPGEVERLTRERDEAGALVDECCEARDGAGFLGSVPDCIEWLKDERATAEAALAESEQNAQGLASDLAGTQAELAATRERLEKVEAGEEVSWVLEWTAAPRPPVHPTTMTGRQTFRSQADAVAFMRRQPSDATFVSLTEVRQTSMDQSDIARAALTGDAQEAGR